MVSVTCQLTKEEIPTLSTFKITQKVMMTIAMWIVSKREVVAWLLSIESPVLRFMHHNVVGRVWSNAWKRIVKLFMIELYIPRAKVGQSSFCWLALCSAHSAWSACLPPVRECNDWTQRAFSSENGYKRRTWKCECKFKLWTPHCTHQKNKVWKATINDTAYFKLMYTWQ